jgi:hypothetical protein
VSLPLLLTVEEAGELLRIGRTKAYAMAREWRETDGRSGLPVIDLGHVLRVPRPALEALIGADLASAVSNSGAPEYFKPGPDLRTDPAPTPTKARRTRRRHKVPTDQLHLFGLPPTPD